jgi:hypothetical protein
VVSSRCSSSSASAATTGHPLVAWMSAPNESSDAGDSSACSKSVTRTARSRVVSTCTPAEARRRANGMAEARRAAMTTWRSAGAWSSNATTNSAVARSSMSRSSMISSVGVEIATLASRPTASARASASPSASGPSRSGATGMSSMLTVLWARCSASAIDRARAAGERVAAAPPKVMAGVAAAH